MEPDQRAPKELLTPNPDEMRLQSRSAAPRKPKRAWTAAVFAFVLEPKTLGVMFWLGCLCGVAGGLVKLARYFNPVAGAAA